MRLTVLSVAYPFAPVAADPVGGAEQVLAQLDRALVAAGHRSLVIAKAGSTPAGELIAIPGPPGPLTDAARETVYATVRSRVAETLARETVDLIHLHGVDYDAYLPPPGLPCLITLHLPLTWHDARALRPTRPDTWLVPVSAHQAASAPADVPLLDPIENGVDLDAFTESPEKGDFALCLGRVCEEKGFHLALDATRAAAVPLRLAGEVFPYPEHQAYFEREIAPRLDDRRRFLGPVTGAAKRRLLAEARCVLIPSLAAETSSLVAREAAAAGTPAIAFPAGALPDAIQHGVTGFLVEDADAMAAAIPRSDEIDPAACRALAASRFDVRRTTAPYLALYAQLTAARHVRRA